MFGFLKPPPPKEPIEEKRVPAEYRSLREQVFLGTFIGYAAYYLLRKNFAMAIPGLEEAGYSKTALAWPLAAISLAYGLSKFFMGSVSDRSNARMFLVLGLWLSAGVNLIFGCFDFATSSIFIMFTFMFLNGWFQGMGWPACGRSMVHWFSISERGTRMSIWNVAHNVGGGLIGVLIPFGIMISGHNDMFGTFAFPAILVIAISILVFFLMRDTPQSCGLPPIEVYRNEYPKDYDQSSEKEMTAKEIFFEHVFRNKFLWYIALANIFVYLIRYGVSDWIPSYLSDVKNYELKKAGLAYFCYEYAGIPGTLLCGIISDWVFKGRRAPACIIFMVLVLFFVIAYWLNPFTNPIFDYILLIGLGFLIYGPVMLIGLHALDLVQKKAAGTAAGLTGLFGYMGGALFANIGMGALVDALGWNACFIVLIISCFLAIFFVALTWNSGATEHHQR